MSRILCVICSVVALTGCAAIQAYDFDASNREVMARIAAIVPGKTQPEPVVETPVRNDGVASITVIAAPAPASIPRTDSPAVSNRASDPPPFRQAFAGQGPVARNAVDFEGTAGRVRSLPDVSSQGVRAVSRQLLEVTSNQWELAWAVFVWVADHIAYDARAFFAGTTPPFDPESVLERRLAVCEGYSRLYTAIAGGAGLRVDQVSGYAKGYGHSPGAPVRGSNHAWNRVLIYGEWYLVDSTWGAGHLSGRTYARHFTPFYFAPDPAALIFSHLPSDVFHQYLADPVDTTTFSRLPRIRPTIFELGLDAQATLTAIRSGSKYDPPEAFATPNLPSFQMRPIELPLASPLRRGQNYRFAVAIDPPLPAVVVVDGRHIQLVYNDGIAEASFVARGREVSLALRPNESARTYNTYLRWSVQ